MGENALNKWHPVILADLRRGADFEGVGLPTRAALRRAGGPYVVLSLVHAGN